MPRKNRTQQKALQKSDELKNHLEETEETLSAIHRGLVDALLVRRSNDTQVVTLNDADFPYRMMVESMNEGAVTLIPDGTIFYCNPRFAEMVQIDIEELIGTPFQSLIREEEQGNFERFFTKAGTVGARDEFCLKNKQETCIPVQLSVYPLGIEITRGISILVTDMTARKQAEEALQKSESLFRLIATSSPDVIFAQDRNLRYTWIINPTPPLPGEQVIGKTDWDLLPPEEARHLTELKQKILEQGISVREELLLSPSGSKRWFDAIYQPLYDQAQQIVGIVCYARDITERVHAEEKIRGLASKLTVAEQEERQRISQILHDDLQQRLFAIKAQLFTLRNMHGSEQAPSHLNLELEGVQAALSEAIGVTRNLSIDLSPVILQGEGLVSALGWLASRMQEQHGLQMKLEATGDFDQLNPHLRMLLFQSVSELLFNVVKHADTLEATVTLEQKEESGYITVSDGGRGFDAEQIINDPTSAHGLRMIQDRLGLMGCSMRITSASNRGTQVVIEVPMERKPA